MISAALGTVFSPVVAAATGDLAVLPRLRDEPDLADVPSQRRLRPEGLLAVLADVVLDDLTHVGGVAVCGNESHGAGLVTPASRSSRDVVNRFGGRVAPPTRPEMEKFTSPEVVVRIRRQRNGPRPEGDDDRTAETTTDGSRRRTELTMERRHLLRTTGIALAAGLAGCTGNGGNETTETDDETTEADDGTDGETTETDGETDGETTETDDGTDGEMSAEISGARLTVDNVGVSAWEVTRDETGSVAETGAENPTMTFEVGQRYAVTNDGWAQHPFAVETGDGTALLSQGRDADGEFEGDADVGWVDEETEFSFTFTEGLASEADAYRCTVHRNSMRGDVESA